MDFNIGDRVITKKNHPCGNNIWEVTRVGADFKLKCEKCGHIVMISRDKAVKSIKNKL